MSIYRVESNSVVNPKIQEKELDKVNDKELANIKEVENNQIVNIKTSGKDLQEAKILAQGIKDMFNKEASKEPNSSNSFASTFRNGNGQGQGKSGRS